MSVLIASNLTVEELVDDDSRDNTPVATNAVAESLGHIWRIRPPGDLTFPNAGAGAPGTRSDGVVAEGRPILRWRQM
ncbi:MAG: hypothetical protein ACXU9S_16230 [Gemmatimonadaceae bacterium]